MTNPEQHEAIGAEQLTPIENAGVLTNIETDLNAVETDVKDVSNVVNDLDETASTAEEDEQDVTNDVTTVITDVDHPTILERAHSFLDQVKGNLAHVIAEAVQGAESIGEAIEHTVLAAIGKAAEEAKEIFNDVTSS
jgi:hypothetical protein